MVVGAVKSLKADSNFTLKKGIFCPNNWEGLNQSPVHQKVSAIFRII